MAESVAFANFADWDDSFTVAEAARYFAAAHASVLPLVPGGKEPLAGLAPHGWKSATCDLAVIAEWWRICPNAGVGIACAPSGIVVVDVDVPESFDELVDSLGPLPETVAALTARGAHYYFRAPADSRFISRPIVGVDVKHRGYVVAPPSPRRTGKAYVWEPYVRQSGPPVSWDSRR